MKWIFFVAAACLVAFGYNMALNASKLPIYTDREAPARLSRELEGLPRDVRSAEWYSQLSKFETKHKTLSDCGRGTFAAGIGLALATVFLVAYNRYAWIRTRWVIFGIWVSLWLSRLPFSYWYYNVRQGRFDYPTWGDSTAIPLYTESIAWFLGAILSSIVLAMLLIRHHLPERVAFSRPQSLWGWLRFAIIGLWLALNVVCVKEGIIDGDEGMTLTCIVSGGVLLILLASKRIEGDALLLAEREHVAPVHDAVEIVVHAGEEA